MKTHGFSIIELMVALAVLAILAAVAVPTFSSFSARQRLRAASFDLHTDLLFARSEALKRNQNVSIQRREAGGWRTGWVVLAGADELRTRGDLGASVTASGPAGAITFNGSGRVASPAGAVQIALESSGGSAQFDRCVVLTPSGMPRAYPEACT